MLVGSVMLKTLKAVNLQSISKKLIWKSQNFEIASHASCLAEPRSVHPVFQLPPLHILFKASIHTSWAAYSTMPAGGKGLERPVWKGLGKG